MTGAIALDLGVVEPQDSAVVVGFFDGVHRGHRSLITRATRVAADRGLRSVVATFDRHPMEVVNPGTQPPLLQTLPRRLLTLSGCDVDLVVPLAFDDDLRHRSPEDFVDSVLCGTLQARHVVVGADFRFGHKAAGNVATLADLGPSRGFSSEGVTLLEVDGTVVSSTVIRGLLEEGNVERAAALLGRPHLLDGVVVRGDRRGATLGFPTANLEVDPRVAVPARGIYAGRFHLPGGARQPAAISVGVNPTFGGSTLRVEAYLLDYQADLYGEHAAVDFRHRLRDEETFDSVDALVAQMTADVAETRRRLAG